MDFTHDGDSMGYRGGGDNALTGIMAGSMLNRKDNDYIWAVIIFAIIFIIAIIALAMFNKDRRNDNGTDIAALLAPLIAAKSMDCNNGKGYDYDHDHLEIKQRIEDSETRRTIADTQKEIAHQGQSFMQLGFGLSNQIKDSEKDNLKEFGEIKQQLGMQSMALTQILTKQNNSDIINGVIQQLTMGAPCFAKC